MPTPTNHIPFKAEFTGLCESRLSTLSDVSANSGSLGPLAAATAQMVLQSGAIRVDDNKSLHIPIMPLRDVVIGRHRLCPDTKSDFGQFLDQPSIRGSTATLVGPRHVITAAHCIVPSEIIRHRFVFGRTADAAHCEVVDKEIVVRKGHYSTAKRLLGYVCTDEVDWAVLELFADVENVQPLPIGRWNPTLSALCLGHPLGLPLKQANVEPIEMALPPNYRIAIDNGSGGSGAPIIQGGALVGVLRGEAVVSPESIVEQRGCLDPYRHPCAVAQPFTPSIHFASALPRLFGW
jgi:hypothetical protein